jgi:hypothetical protein
MSSIPEPLYQRISVAHARPMRNRGITQSCLPPPMVGIRVNCASQIAENVRYSKILRETCCALNDSKPPPATTDRRGFAYPAAPDPPGWAFPVRADPFPAFMSFRISTSRCSAPSARSSVRRPWPRGECVFHGGADANSKAGRRWRHAPIRRGRVDGPVDLPALPYSGSDSAAA